MALDTLVERARFIVQSGPAQGSSVPVHFNPVSLDYTVANNIKNKGRGSKKKQYVSQSTAKLAMELVFDTTGDGKDVRAITEQIAAFMEPAGKTPSIVRFEWGLYRFQGMVESYKETVDFFSADAVPLRATVKLTLSRQDKVFEAGLHADTNVAGNASAAPVQAPTGGGGAGAPPSPGGAADTAGKAGDPAAARAIGAANGEASLRFSASASLDVEASVTLGGPVAFASGGAGIGAGAGLGIDAGASLDLGATGGAGLSLGGAAGAGLAAGASFGASASSGAAAGASFGGVSSAGVSASAGAFSGIRAGVGSGAKASLNVDALLPEAPSAGLSIGGKGDVSLSGQASVGGSASLQADVGQSVSLRDRIRFEEG